MPPPVGYADFYELELQINYNNSAAVYLQQFATSIQPPEERQAGWNERYIMSTPPAGSPPYAPCYTLTQARAALLGVNFYVKKAIIHQASVFKSSFPLPNSAKYGLFDSLATNASDTQNCSSPEETILLRQEAGNLRRWEYQIRGIKDYMADDAMTNFAALSYCNNANTPPTGVFDTVATAIPAPNSTGGTQATFAVTLTSGVPSAPTGAANGNFLGVAAGTYYTYLLPSNGIGNPAIGLVTINGANQATGVANLVAGTGSGWTSTTAIVPLSNDPYGLPNYQLPSYYWANFMSAIINYTASGTIRRVAQSTFTAPNPTFPSGLAPTIFGSLQTCTRSLFQRVGNRQTGQIRLTKKARVKRGI